MVNKISDYDIEYTKFKKEKNDDELIFKHTITDQKSISVDNEHGITTTDFINSMNVHIYEHENGDYIQANWTKDTYYLFLVYYGDIEKDDFVELIKSIK